LEESIGERSQELLEETTPKLRQSFGSLKEKPIVKKVLERKKSESIEKWLTARVEAFCHSRKKTTQKLGRR